MFEDRSLKLDLFALVMFALVLFVGIALWTYDPADPPSTLVWPPQETVNNSCGRAGAVTAHYLFESLGIGAYYFAGTLFALALLLLRRREINQPILRTIGWAISVAGLATLAALSIPSWTPGPVVGATWKTTFPFPVPFRPPVMVIHGTPDVADQAHWLVV